MRFPIFSLATLSACLSASLLTLAGQGLYANAQAEEANANSAKNNNIDTAAAARSFIAQKRYDLAIKVCDVKINKYANPQNPWKVLPEDYRLDLLGHALVFRQMTAADLQHIYLADMHNLKGIALYYQNKYQEAKDSFEKAISLNPYFSQALCNLGGVNLKMGKTAQALNYFDKALKYNPRSEDVYRNRAEAYKSMKQFDKSQKELETYHYWRKLNAKEEINLGLLSKFEYCEQVLLKRPRTDANLTALGVIHWENLRLKESEKTFQEAIAVNPKFAEAHSAYGMLLLWEKKHAQAAREFTTAVNLDPTFVAPLYNRVRANLPLKKYDAVLADCRQLLEMKNRTPGLERRAHAARGEVYLEQKLYQKSINEFTQAITAKCPVNERSTYHVGRGAAYQAMGNKEMALQEYDLALNYAPQNKVAFEKRGKVMLSMGQYEQAMVDIGTSKSAKVDDISNEPPSQEELSRLIADYDKNLKLFPGSTESLYNRGLLFLIKGDYARAAADFNKVVTLTKKANLTSDYAVCFGSIALRLDNKKTEEVQLTSKYLQINRSETMPEEVRKFLENKNVTIVIFKDMSGKVEQKTRVLTLFGLDAYARGNKVKAREYLNAVKNGGEPSMDEFALALAYLKKVQ